MENTNKKSSLAITLSTIAIIIGVLALVLVLVNKDGSKKTKGFYIPEEKVEQKGPDFSEFRDMDMNTDHYVGDLKKAEIVIIEYSDFQCPFCSRVHITLEKLVEDYDGKVAWIYRHLPLGSHKEAIPSAIASECVAKIAGNDAFWAFTNTLYKNQSELGDDLYKSEVAELGIDENQYLECIESEEILNEVLDDINEASNIGVRGTPYSLIMKGKELNPVSGALPYENFKVIIDELLE